MVLRRRVRIKKQSLDNDRRGVTSNIRHHPINGAVASLTFCAAGFFTHRCFFLAVRFLLYQDSMDGLGAAANVIAVIDLTAKVASLCFQYSKAVKNAKSDIERLKGELDRLQTTLEGARQLLESPNGARLQTSQRLSDGLRQCSSQLLGLEIKLEKKLHTGPGRKIMRRLGVRALVWPFESKDVDGIIGILERYRDTLSAALAIDQTYVATSSLDLLMLMRSTELSSLISAGHSFFPSCPLRKMQHLTLMLMSTTHNATPKPGLPSVRR